MKRILLLLFTLVPSTAFAIGVDLTWNDCVNGTAGTAQTNKVLDCVIAGNRNYNLEFQYKTPIDIPNFVAVTGYVDIGPTGAPLSPFWHYESGGCNQGTVKGAQILGTIPASCADGGYLETWDGGPSGTFAIAAYAADYQQPGRGHFVLLGARGDAYPIVSGDNMWAFELRLNNRNRPGSGGNCAGCTDQKSITCSVIRLESNDGSPAIDLSGADKLTDCVVVNSANFATCIVDAVSSTTWGALKSLHR